VEGDTVGNAALRKPVPGDAGAARKRADIEQFLRNREKSRSRRALMETVQNVVSKVIGLAVLVAAFGIVGVILGGVFRRTTRRSGPTREAIQADTPLLETEEFY
jgi:hypothetical protein